MNELGDETRFATILEECCGRVKRGEALERCLDDYPAEYREELAQLVPLAASVSTLRHNPTPEFRARLEGRLLASLEERRRSRRTGLMARVSRSLVALPVGRIATLAALVLVLLVGGVSVVQAEDSLPDSPLYQVKTAREWVELALARDGDTRVGVYLRHIAKRGKELEAAVRADKPRVVVAALTFRLGRTTNQMVDLALELRDRGRPGATAGALTLLRAMDREVQRLAEQSPPQHRPTLRALHLFLGKQEQRLQEDAPERPPMPAVAPPGADRTSGPTE